MYAKVPTSTSSCQRSLKGRSLAAKCRHRQLLPSITCCSPKPSPPGTKPRKPAGFPRLPDRFKLRKSPPSGPDGQPPEPPPGPRLPPQIELYLSLITRLAGIPGTAAVTIAWFTHIDVYGSFHYDPRDLYIGLAASLPAVLLYITIMIPKWGEGVEDPTRLLIQQVVQAQKQQKERVGRIFSSSVPSTSDSDPAPGNDPNNPSSSTDQSSPTSPPSISPASTASVSSPLPDPAPSSPSNTVPAELWGRPPAKRRSAFEDALRLALQRLQDQFMKNNLGLGLTPVMEASTILVACFAQEMLYRAVLFTLLSSWIRDRFYEAGADDTIVLWNTLELSTSDAAKWSTVVLGLVAGTGLVIRGALRARNMAKVDVVVVHTKGARPSPQLQSMDMGPRMANTLTATVAIEGFIDLLDTMAATVAFTLTGNLAASFAATAIGEASMSALQRYTFQRRAKALRRRLGQLRSRVASTAADAREQLDKQQLQAGEDSGTSAGSSADGQNPGSKLSSPDGLGNLDAAPDASNTLESSSYSRRDEVSGLDSSNSASTSSSPPTANGASSPSSRLSDDDTIIDRLLAGVDTPSQVPSTSAPDSKQNASTSTPQQSPDLAVHGVAANTGPQNGVSSNDSSGHDSGSERGVELVVSTASPNGVEGTLEGSAPGRNSEQEGQLPVQLENGSGVGGSTATVKVDEAQVVASKTSR